MEARKLVGWNLRRLRTARGLTIEELGDQAALDPSSVARIERGTANPGIMTIEKLAVALGVGLAEFVVEPGDGDEPPRPLKAGRKAK